MAHGLFGTFTCPLDEKNRAVLPATLRESVSLEKLRDGFWITRGFEGCLMMFLREDWRRVTEKVDKLAFTNPQVRLFKRLFLTPAEAVQLDRVGRVSLSETHRGLAGIDRELVFNGGGSYVEIWAPERWARYCADHQAEFEEVAAKLLDGLYGEPETPASDLAKADPPNGGMSKGEKRGD